MLHLNVAPTLVIDPTLVSSGALMKLGADAFTTYVVLWSLSVAEKDQLLADPDPVADHLSWPAERAVLALKRLVDSGWVREAGDRVALASLGGQRPLVYADAVRGSMLNELGDQLRKEAEERSATALAEKALRKLNALEKQGGHRIAPKSASGSDVEEAFRQALREKHGVGFRLATWTIAQRKLGEQLVAQYGVELALKGVGELVQNFDRLRTELRINAAQPSINLLWGFRDTIFGNLQEHGAVLPKEQPKNRKDEHPDANADNDWMK